MHSLLEPKTLREKEGAARALRSACHQKISAIAHRQALEREPLKALWSKVLAVDHPGHVWLWP